MSSSFALVSRVSRRIRKEIQSGRLGVSGRLPPVRDLSSRLNLSVPTVLDGIKLLEQWGVVRRRHGSGIYVNPIEERTLEVAVLQSNYPSPRFEMISDSVNAMCAQRQFHFTRRVVPLEPREEADLPDFADVIAYLAPTHPLQPRWLALAADHCQVLVIMDYMLDVMAVDSISVDGVDMTRQAVDYLYQKGHRKIVYLYNSPEIYEVLLRYATAARRAVELGIELRQLDCHVRPGEDGRELARQKLIGEASAGRLSATAILAQNHAGALGARDACRELGLSIPKQMSIVGMNDHRECRDVQPALSMIAEESNAFGAAMSDMIDRRIYQNEQEYLHLKSRATLVERGSVRQIAVPGSA